MKLTDSVALLPVFIFAACSNGSEAPADELFFPTDVRAAEYEQVRPCRAPGEHSALGGFTVWVNPESRNAFDAIWAEPSRVTELPSGAVIVKEVYDGSDCAPDDVVGWLAMKKERGFAPSDGDWNWQEADREGNLVAEGAVPSCIDCHRGSQRTTCVGYGSENGRDYLCTEP